MVSNGDISEVVTDEEDEEITKKTPEVNVSENNTILYCFVLFNLSSG